MSLGVLKDTLWLHFIVTCFELGPAEGKRDIYDILAALPRRQAGLRPAERAPYFNTRPYGSPLKN